jgi:hypothetical protein
VQDDSDYEARVWSASEERKLFWDTLGKTEDTVLAPLIDPSLMGGPAWPVRPQYRVIFRDGVRALVSDGLSSPFQDDRGPGFGVEVILEPVEDNVDAPLAEWILPTVTEICNVVAGHGGVRSLLDELGTISAEVDGAPFPAALRNEHGRVGVLLGLQTPDLPEEFESPEGPVRLVAITVLMPPELTQIVAGGDAARLELGRRLAESPTRHRSALSRPSVV